ncbi:hypothetical protein ACFYPA_21720 [Streptomyces sp. NPDC005775]|uniref:hypothetical protein n=1 Tax=Streptomyces sp. NPDC005775 TaxID=3364729 RepID=UPI003681F3BD
MVPPPGLLRAADISPERADDVNVLGEVDASFVTELVQHPTQRSALPGNPASAAATFTQQLRGW